MAAGCALVSTTAGCIPEWCVSEVTSLIVKTKDSNALFLQLSRLIENKKLMEKLGKKGQETVKKEFSWVRSAKKLEQILLNTLNNSKNL